MRNYRTIIMVGLALLVVWGIGSYFYTNATYIEKPLNAMVAAGFTEKQVTLRDGTILNYGEGPANGKPPLLLIHGQGVTWEDYAKVLPGLAEHFHVYAVDCHGHGESSWNPDKYSAKAMAADFAEFIETVIGAPVLLSGHSSGGMVAAWMAAHTPELVLGTVIEDAPFFATEPGRREVTYAWVYGFQLYEDFKHQDEVDDYFIYFLEHNYWRKVFGDFLWNRFSQDAIAYHERHPNEPVHLIYLPPLINRLFEAATYPYDQRFGESFYDNSWFEGYDQAEVLAMINTPTIFIKATTRYDGDLLLAALSEEDAARVVALLEHGTRVDVEAGHDVHYEQPERFTEILVDFLDEVQ